MSDVNMFEPEVKKAPRKPRPSEIRKKEAKQVSSAKKAKTTKGATRKPPKVDLILSGSFQRGGGVGAGLTRPSGVQQVTFVLPAKQFKQLQLLARKNNISLSEAVRQCVTTGLVA